MSKKTENDAHLAQSFTYIARASLVWLRDTKVDFKLKFKTQPGKRPRNMAALSRHIFLVLMFNALTQSSMR